MELQNYAPRDLQIKRFVGEMGFMEITDWEYFGGGRNPLDPSAPQRTVSKGGATVRLFEASTPAAERVLLKEFPAAVAQLAGNELSVHQRLARSWEARGGAADAAPSSVLMGSLVADETFDNLRFIERWMTKFPTLTPPRQGNMWLVFKWESLMSFASFPTAKQEGEYLLDVIDPTRRLRRRTAFLRAMMAAAVQAVASIHEAGVAHRSLGPSSFRINTADERTPETLTVRLADFAFASSLGDPDEATLRRAARLAGMPASGRVSPLAVASILVREDLQCLGYTFLELLLSSLSEANRDTGSSPMGAAVGRPQQGDKPAGESAPALTRPTDQRSAHIAAAPQPSTRRSRARAAAAHAPSTRFGLTAPSDSRSSASTTSLRRLVEDIYKLDVTGRFREYAAAEDTWCAAVAFLDEDDGAGWAVLQALIGGSGSGGGGEAAGPSTAGAAAQSLSGARAVLAMPFFAAARAAASR
ncbi:hypothetical protein JKP88DRAFT_349571 [Tribonema minus]|uniref:Protein kinase domain-containing protein n=1 Tax=Tribonema minus TaxID=303371 RepID=A0A835YSX6_9STRA|nr:hypothetical protein JKP88DRAFT_349571 [Tribonema minus]